MQIELGVLPRKPNCLLFKPGSHVWNFFRKTLKPFVKPYENYFRKHVHMYGIFFRKVNFVAFEILSIQNGGVE